MDVATLLAGSFTAMGRLIADPRVPTAGVQMKAHNVMEGFLEVLGRWGVGRQAKQRARSRHGW
jgi:hypothetical protein